MAGGLDHQRRALATSQVPHCVDHVVGVRVECHLGAVAHRECAPVGQGLGGDDPANAPLPQHPGEEQADAALTQHHRGLRDLRRHEPLERKNHGAERLGEDQLLVSYFAIEPH